MKTNKLIPLFGIVFLFSAGVSFASEEKPEKALAETIVEPNRLPDSMHGRWHNPGSGHSNLIEIAVKERLSATHARIEITWWPYCKKAESDMRFEKGVWKFSAVNCQTGSGGTRINATVRPPAEGKNRMDGYYGSETSGRTVYLEWK